MKDGDGVVIVDAGGGTVDISSYSKNVGEAKDAFEEVAAPQCKTFQSSLSKQSHNFLQATSMARYSLPSMHGCS
jgi:hypothetical protein